MLGAREWLTAPCSAVGPPPKTRVREGFHGVNRDGGQAGVGKAHLGWEISLKKVMEN